MTRQHGLVTQGDSYRPEYQIWVVMRRRCEDVKHVSYSRYGGVGVTVCPEWRRNFAAFFSYVGPRPTPKHTIDRIDNSKGYEPGNVRWATHKEQARNKKSTRLVTFEGKTQTVPDWARDLGIGESTLRNRLNNGLTVEKAFSHERIGRHD